MPSGRRWPPATVDCGDPAVIRTGVVLPTFRESPDDAFAAAEACFAAGVDGVFCYDHIWPMGQPDRPALAPFPILATLAARTSDPAAPGAGAWLGTLVARVGLVPPAVLVAQFTALENLAPGRVIAALGTGDRLSEAENLAYGVPYPTKAERRGEMVAVGRALREAGLTVWLAAGHAARTAEARSAGVAANLWDTDAGLVASAGAPTAVDPAPLEITWGGPPPPDEEGLRAKVAEMAAAGATWVVFGWPVDPAALVAAARQAGV